jgi:1,2-diacylglycerol 3-beta-glucosyltransferase
MSARLCASVLRAARGVVIWMTAMVGLLAGDAYVANTAAMAGPGAQAAPGVAARSGLRPAAGPILVFRVDVSRYPQVGVVVTVPDSQERLTSSEFAVLSGDHSVSPNVRQLSANNVQLMLVPDTGLGSARWREEQHAAARFLVDLPDGAQTAVVDPVRPGWPARGLTRDATSSVARLAALPGGTLSPAARLAAALSGFARGLRVRRTVVLVVSSPVPLAEATAAHFREQLAASGTALYVLDASPRRDPGYDALAAESGGRAIRVRSAAGWSGAFRRIVSDLGEQYYLRFADTYPLPGRVKILVRTSLGTEYGIAALPAVNPIAPPPLPPVKPPVSRASWDRPLVWLAALLVIFGAGYGLLMLAASRREPRVPKGPARHAVSGPAGHPPGSGLARPPGAERSVAVVSPLPGGAGVVAVGGLPVVADGLFFVFLMPCLNEEKVILGSLQRLLSLPGGNFVVLVIDDGSDDRTAEVVGAAVGDQVWLLSRKPPEARQGKGEALNAAVRFLTGSGRLAGRDPGQVIVVVVDADGRLDPHAVSAVSPYFADPMVGAVQIGVRINNRGASRLARMQDMEFVIYTEVFQRGRRHLGSVGLGGNGQFMRLSALLSLGGSPWTRSLTDDLDLGVRLLAAGWRNEYCSAAAVHQQGVVELRRLIRQRSRWFQGHLQSWTLIPLVLRSTPRRARSDLLYHLSSPAILLIASFLSASFVLSLANCVVLLAQGRNPFGWWIATTYALTFGPALAYGLVYWSRERANGVSLPRVAGLAHLYVCYGMIWYASGWWAVVRTLRGRTGWAKTDRVAEAPVALSLPAATGASAMPARVVALAHDVPITPGQLAAQLAEAPTQPIPTVPPPPVPVLSGPVLPSPVGPGTAEPAGGQPRARLAGRRRRRAKALTVGAALVCATVGAGLAWSAVTGQGTGPGQWLTVFTGYGHTEVTGSGLAQTIMTAPSTTRSRRATHAALVVSRGRYADFVATLRVQTVRQLRRGAAGRPNPWEVGWVVWHYTSEHSFYALTLEPTGWLLSKQDPAYPGGERFLASGRTPRFRVGVPHRVGIVQIGDQITVSGDGQLLTRFTDTRRPYLRGSFGAYSEDSDARFWDIRVRTLPSPALGFGPAAAPGRRDTPGARPPTPASPR